jgi:hypothetical protein
MSDKSQSDIFGSYQRKLAERQREASDRNPGLILQRLIAAGGQATRSDLKQLAGLEETAFTAALNVLLHMGQVKEQGSMIIATKEGYLATSRS